MARAVHVQRLDKKGKFLIKEAGPLSLGPHFLPLQRLHLFACYSVCIACDDIIVTVTDDIVVRKLLYLGS
jgi:hypothetical protein